MIWLLAFLVSNVAFGQTIETDMNDDVRVGISTDTTTLTVLAHPQWWWQKKPPSCGPFGVSSECIMPANYDEARCAEESQKSQIANLQEGFFYRSISPVSYCNRECDSDDFKRFSWKSLRDTVLDYTRICYHVCKKAVDDKLAIPVECVNLKNTPERKSAWAEIKAQWENLENDPIAKGMIKDIEVIVEQINATATNIESTRQASARAIKFYGSVFPEKIKNLNTLTGDFNRIAMGISQKNKDQYTAIENPITQSMDQVAMVERPDMPTIMKSYNDLVNVQGKVCIPVDAEKVAEMGRVFDSIKGKSMHLLKEIAQINADYPTEEMRALTEHLQWLVARDFVAFNRQAYQSTKNAAKEYCNLYTRALALVLIKKAAEELNQSIENNNQIVDQVSSFFNEDNKIRGFIVTRQRILFGVGEMRRMLSTAQTEKNLVVGRHIARELFQTSFYKIFPRIELMDVSQEEKDALVSEIRSVVEPAVTQWNEFSVGNEADILRYKASRVSKMIAAIRSRASSLPDAEVQNMYQKSLAEILEEYPTIVKNGIVQLPQGDPYELDKPLTGLSVAVSDIYRLMRGGDQ